MATMEDGGRGFGAPGYNFSNFFLLGKKRKVWIERECWWLQFCFCLNQDVNRSNDMKVTLRNVSREILLSE